MSIETLKVLQSVAMCNDVSNFWLLLRYRIVVQRKIKRNCGRLTLNRQALFVSRQIGSDSGVKQRRVGNETETTFC